MLACTWLLALSALVPGADPGDLESARALGERFVAISRCHPAERWQERRTRIEEESATADARRERIGEELRTLRDDHPWAGVYTFGDGRGVNVVLRAAPGAGVVYAWRGCMGLYDLDHGDVVEVGPGRLRVDWLIDPELSDRLWYGARSVPLVSEELVVVTWEEARWLVPTSLMIPFCNQVSRWSARRDWTRWSFPLWMRCEPSPPPSPPNLPVSAYGLATHSSMRPVPSPLPAGRARGVPAVPARARAGGRAPRGDGIGRSL